MKRVHLVVKRPNHGCAWQATGGRGGGSDPSPACGPKPMSFTGRRCPFGGRRPGPRRLVRTPVAVHLLPSEKVGPIRRSRVRGTISLSQGRGWLAAGAFTSRGGPGEGSLPRLLDRRPNNLHHFAHELVRVLKHHRIWNAQQSNAEVRKCCLTPFPSPDTISLTISPLRGDNPGGVAAGTGAGCKPIVAGDRVQAERLADSEGSDNHSSSGSGSQCKRFIVKCPRRCKRAAVLPV